MALPIDVTDPGSVNIADQAFGVGLPRQVTVTVEDNTSVPAIASVNNVAGADSRPGIGVAADVANDQVAEQSVAAIPVRVVDGGDFKPGGVPTDFADDDVAEQPSATKSPNYIDAGSASQVRNPIVNVVDSGVVNVETQVYGTGTPRNVFV